jgi:hypothetical protein
VPGTLIRTFLGTIDEAAYDDPGQTLMEIPNELVPAVQELLAKKTV